MILCRSPSLLCAVQAIYLEHVRLEYAGSGQIEIHCEIHTVAIWCSGSALVTINVVILHRARLVLGWVRIAFAPSRFLTSHPGQLSLVIPSG